MNELAICAGYGGFSLALKSVYGVAHRTVCYVERDGYAAATLVARMEEQKLDRAPIWSDASTFDGRAWRGKVDIITAGFPCQPFSAAGAQRGVEDSRWLWPQIARIVGEVGPGIVFLENVPGLVTRGGAHVLGDLASLGFDAEWGVLGAAAVGAPHVRERVWIVAHSHGAQLQGHGIARRVSAPIPVDAGGGLHGHAWPPPPGDFQGSEWGGAEPALRRGADGAPEWLADRLHLGGNGLVPQCAAEAYTLLAGRFSERMDVAA